MKTLLIYDGECGFCRRSVDILWDLLGKDNHYEIVANHAVNDPRWTPELLQKSERFFITIAADGVVYLGADAVNFLLRSTRYRWLSTLMKFPPLLWFERAAYRYVANHRQFFSRLFFNTDSCSLPPKPGP